MDKQANNQPLNNLTTNKDTHTHTNENKLTKGQKTDD